VADILPFDQVLEVEVLRSDGLRRLRDEALEDVDPAVGRVVGVERRSKCL
jgi:hypothetical protein